MPSYAVVLAGVPAKVVDSVMPALKADFASSHVFLSDRAKEFGDKRARYDNQAVQTIINTCAEALFGRTTRPFSFCRRPGAHCEIRAGGKGSAKCGKTDERACGLNKPDHLIVLYQPSHDDGVLMRSLCFTALAKKLPVGCYGHFGSTLSSVKQALAQAKVELSSIHASITRGRGTPVLLPIRNYNPQAVIGFLRGCLSRDNLSATEKRFRYRFWNEASRAYETSSGLMFAPTVGATSHGDPGDAETAIRSLAGHYRLGVNYDPGFHYDVTPSPPSTLKGQEFECIEKGLVVCKASTEYANIYPNDFVRIA